MLAAVKVPVPPSPQAWPRLLPCPLPAIHAGMHCWQHAAATGSALRGPGLLRVHFQASGRPGHQRGSRGLAETRGRQYHTHGGPVDMACEAAASARCPARVAQARSGKSGPSASPSHSGQHPQFCRVLSRRSTTGSHRKQWQRRPVGQRDSGHCGRLCCCCAGGGGRRVCAVAPAPAKAGTQGCGSIYGIRGWRQGAGVGRQPGLDFRRGQLPRRARHAASHAATAWHLPAV